MIIPFVAILVLYLNIRKVAEGTKGVLIAGLPIILTFGSFFLARQNSAFFSWVQCFMVIWLCQALWMYILWSLFLGLRAIYRKTLGKKPGRLQYKTNFARNGARIILAATVLLTAGLLAYGIPNHYDYKTRTLDVEFKMAPYSAPAENSFVEDSTAKVPATVTWTESHRDFKAVFFSDLHIDPLFKQEKLERLIAQCDSVKPDFILFGGDMADVHDSVLTAQGYDKLMQRLAATAKVAAVGINGNHEAYMERSGSDPEGFLRRAGWIFLDDSTACIPAEAPVACFTGRRDFQKARVFEEDRKRLKELTAENPMAAHLTTSAHSVPWIVLDHQPKGVEEDFGEFRPDFALSGHTHDGQFFPGNILINWIWPLAYGEGFLNDIHWLVSAGIDSWGPPVRAGSDSEIWVINFKVNRIK
ncbi:MAG: metallophosphoesterase [Fibrobacter sp.]|nr:metallophosphoesterase [Fibrobacter sp.]